MGLIDVIGMNTVYNVLMHWGGISEDRQMLDNAAHIKAHIIDKGHMGTQSGRGYYSYPDPAYMAPDFLAVPARSAVPELLEKIRLG